MALFFNLIMYDFELNYVKGIYIISLFFKFLHAPMLYNHSFGLLSQHLLPRSMKGINIEISAYI